MPKRPIERPKTVSGPHDIIRRQNTQFIESEHTFVVQEKRSRKCSVEEQFRQRLGAVSLEPIIRHFGHGIMCKRHEATVVCADPSELAGFDRWFFVGHGSQVHGHCAAIGKVCNQIADRLGNCGGNQRPSRFLPLLDDRWISISYPLLMQNLLFSKEFLVFLGKSHRRLLQIGTSTGLPSGGAASAVEAIKRQTRVPMMRQVRWWRGVMRLPPDANSRCGDCSPFAIRMGEARNALTKPKSICSCRARS
jgi:hypothetical protein